MRWERTAGFVACVGWIVGVGCGGGPGSAAPASSSAASETRDARPAEVARLDTLLENAWTNAGISPAEGVDDATFLRRAKLDLAGVIPTPAELAELAADTSEERRAHALDRILASKEHALHVARLWEDRLLGPEVKNRVVDRGAFRRWLARKIEADEGWDAIVRELVGASGRSSVGGRGEREDAELDEGVNGATNFFVRYAKSPQDAAGQTARALLGVQIQCAECHDHKTEAWKRDDFRAFASIFTRVKLEPNGSKEKGALKVFDVASTKRPARRFAKRGSPDVEAIAETAPRALDGTDLSSADDTRAALGAWMTSPENPWFSRAIVNRVWAELVGRGLVEPVDDLAASNPPILPEVLDALAEEFEGHGFDLDWLYRTIALSRAYDRGLGGAADSRAALFSSAELRALSSDQLLDSICAATDIAARDPEAFASRIERVRRRMSFVFAEDSESNGGDYEGTLQQALFLMNGQLVSAATAYTDDSALAKLAASSDADSEVIAAIFERTLGRAPTVEEADAALALVNGEDANASSGKRPKRKNAGKKRGALGVGRSDADEARERGFEDLLWVLVNSSEFSFRR
ncbi:MAG: DUF1553 domain-containing protein [Polyangiaceae bacterium]